MCIDEQTRASGAGRLTGARLARNLRAGLRAATLRPIGADDFRVDGVQVLLLALLNLGLLVLGDYVTTEPARYLDPYGVAYRGTLCLGFLLGVFLVAGAQRDLAGIARLLVLLLAASPVVAVAMIVLQTAILGDTDLDAGRAGIGTLVLALWYLLIVARCLRTLYQPARGRLTGLLIVFASASLTIHATLPEQGIWYAYDPSADEASAIDVEATYYAQAGLVDDAVDALLAQRPGVVDLYFVGFAPYAPQDVFKSEVDAVQALFDQRFDTAGRSLVLVNHADTVHHTPLASGNNLRWVLGDIGRIMDPEEDILFAYLTSHGSADAALSVSLWPLQLNNLSAGELREMLDESGIRWRVLVVSACYSGSFIEALKNEDTLILTAADADKQSFGCSNERDFTYFGEAYVRDQLSQSRSFTEAFYRARDAIAQREQVEGHDPSVPQIWIGARIMEQLARLQSRIGS